MIEDLNLWGLKLSPKLVSMPGRVVIGEDIYLGNNKKADYNYDDADWARGLRGKYALRIF